MSHESPVAMPLNTRKSQFLGLSELSGCHFLATLKSKTSIKMTTIVLINVAKSLSISFTPSFAKIAVSAAKTAERAA